MTNALTFALWFLASLGVVDEPSGCTAAPTPDASTQCFVTPPPTQAEEPTNTTPPRRPERRRISNGF